MKFDLKSQITEDNFDESINVREVLEKYIRHYKWFLLSVLIFGVLAFFKLRYEVPRYNVSATVLIKDKEKGSSFSDLSAFEDLGLFGSGDNSLENEIQIIKSRGLMMQVVKELKLNIRYFIEESPYDIEQYPNFPIILNYKSDSSTINNIVTNFKILIKSDKEFDFFDFKGNFIGKQRFGQDFEANLGNEFNSNKRLINIELNDNDSGNLLGKTVRVQIGSINGVVNNYLSRIVIEPVNERLSKVLILSIQESVRQKGVAIINNLIEQYNADGISDKNEISQATTDFLDLRIGLLSAELSAIEGSAEQFKTQNRMVNANSGADIFLESSSSNERELVAANTQLQLVDLMFDELNTSDSGELLPVNIGLSNPSVVAMISEYNDLVLKRNRILKSSSEINPIIVNIDSQLNVLRSNLISNLNSIKSSSQLQIEALDRQGGRINSRIASLPKNEREFKEIVRQQETKNALYLFLLQKREESILANAVSVDKAKILDKAYSNGIAVSPKKATTYFGSIILGLIIPFLIIYIRDLLDTKIHEEKDIKKIRIPYLGDIPHTSSKKLSISVEDNSAIAEAFRYVRTNISFMLEDNKMGKTVFITSTQSHEGKTFTAINLASSLALSGKKTLLLAMDLRAPKITKYLKLQDDSLGVTHFVKNFDLTINEITLIHPSIHNLSIISSGIVPPNPVELLMSERVKEIFNKLKEDYEYIIVDTAPVGMVTDAIQIGKFADLTIYVVRANYLDKRMLHIPEKIHRENKLPNMAILINDSDHSKGAYGYGYGYGYGNKKEKPWYKKIFGSPQV
jgi:capsular exopolysaccharide synthesis family protein